MAAPSPGMTVYCSSTPHTTYNGDCNSRVKSSASSDVPIPIMVKARPHTIQSPVNQVSRLGLHSPITAASVTHSGNSCDRVPHISPSFCSSGPAPKGGEGAGDTFLASCTSPSWSACSGSASTGRGSSRCSNVLIADGTPATLITRVLPGDSHSSSTRIRSTPFGTFSVLLLPSSHSTPPECLRTHLNSQVDPGAKSKLTRHKCPSVHSITAPASVFQSPSCCSSPPTSDRDSPNPTSLLIRNSTLTRPSRTGSVVPLPVASSIGSGDSDRPKDAGGGATRRRAAP
mmetsp:Transcript_16914/g.30197  ORF Transcript_16914/g.30197 Transcript_16914/m.30197 type:complete len:286 (-) Transcript_16914:198-1055(-)